jgi:hypothetical protein
MLGWGETPREADVIRNIAANLGRFAKKAQALDMQRAAGATHDRRQPHISLAERIRMSTIISRVIDYAHDMQQRMTRGIDDQHMTQAQRDIARSHSVNREDQPRHDHQHQRGPSLRM